MNSGGTNVNTDIKMNSRLVKYLTVAHGSHHF